jgi:hypothetical protein
VLAKLRETISVSKWARKQSDLERFDLKKFDDIENLDEGLGINSTWGSIRDSVNTSAKENLGYNRLKYNEPWFDDEYSKLIDQEKQATLQLLQNPSQINGDNLQNFRHETNRTFRNKKREYLKDKINDLVTNNRTKNIRDLYRGINEFRNGYQPRINIIKDENGNLLADPHSVLNRWKNFFNQVLNVHEVHDVRQMDIHMAETLLPETSLDEVEIGI